MKTINLICTVVCGLIVVIILSLKLLLIHVDVGQAGVLTQQYAIFGEKGVKQKDFGPGWHLDLGPIHSWTMFDTTVQTIGMTGAQKVQLKTSDGNTVQLDITIKFKIKPESTHLLYGDAGSEMTYKSIVRNSALDTFRDVYGNVSTEEFYNPTVRRVSTDRARELLTKKLDVRYVDLLDILVRDIEFDPQYEKKIQDKKLADQDVELNRSQAAAAEKTGETQRILAEADADVKVIDKEREAELITMRAETEKEIATITAEADRYATENRAEVDLLAAELIANGTRLVREAEAEGERQKAQALSGPGGANVVALEAAKNISLKSMTLSTIDTDFLDIEAMVLMLGAVGKAAGAAQP